MTSGIPDGAKGARWPLGGALAIFSCGFVVVAWPWLSGAVTIPWDAKSSFFTQQVFLARSLAAGNSPFWTPNVFAGWPQIADPQSLIFSPLHVLLALAVPAPDFRAADAVTFAALFVGGLGVVLLFRERGWHAGGAVVAALAFAFGGACASRLQHAGQIMSVAWLPLALWLTVRALDRPTMARGAAAGITAALIALGRDQVALLSLYVLIAFAANCWLTSDQRWAWLRTRFKALAAAAVTGLALVALPMLLTALLAADSNRPAIDFVGAGRGSLHPAHLLTFVFADLFGAADPAVPYWGPPSFPWGPTDLFLAQNMGQLYAGALPLVALLAVGIGGGALWAREIRFFTLAALVVLLYALGWYTPAFRAMYELIPGVALFRRPADAAFVLGALVAILGGYCVHRWLSDPHVSRFSWLIAFIGVAASGAAAIGLSLSVGVLPATVRPIAFGIAWIAIAAAALLAARLSAGRTVLAAVLLAGVTTADLAWNNAPNESTGLPPSTYDALRIDTQNETIALLKARLASGAASDRRDRVELSGLGYHWPNASLVHGFDGLFGHNPLRLRAFARATGVGDTVAVPDQRGFAPLFPSYRSALADLFGLRYIATGVPVEEIDRALAPGDLTLVARTADAYVYENPRALPRVMMFSEWKRADFDALLREGWPDIDPRRIVLLEREPPSFPTAPPAAPGTARILRYTNTDIVVQAEAPSGGILLLNDVWHPWWRASVVGAPATILKANVLFRAVVVPPGRHTVRFTFHPVAGAVEQLSARLGLTKLQR